MRILFICEEYPPAKSGGIGTMVQELSRELVKQGHQVYVAGLYELEYGAKNFEEDQGVKIWRRRYFLDHALKLIKINFLKRALLKLFKISGLYNSDIKTSSKHFFKFIKSLVKRYQIDIIEMPDWNNFLYKLKKSNFELKFGVPLVIKFHGSYSYFRSETGKQPEPIYQEIDKNIISAADKLLAVSNFTAERNKELFAIKNKIKVIHNSIAEVPLPTGLSKSKNNQVFFSGSLIEKKGIFQLIKAWNIVIENFPDVKLVIFGKGDELPLQKLLQNRAKVTVVFQGHRSREELFKCLQESTLAVFPSFAEAFAFAPLEAMMCNCPTIYTILGSGKELIDDGENGLLIDPTDEKMIAEKILYLLNNPEYRSHLATNARKHVLEKFDVKKAAAEHLEFYREAIDSFRQQ